MEKRLSDLELGEKAVICRITRTGAVWRRILNVRSYTYVHMTL